MSEVYKPQEPSIELTHEQLYEIIDKEEPFMLQVRAIYALTELVLKEADIEIVFKRGEDE